MYWNNWNICVWCTEGWKCQILPMRNLASFSPYLLSKPDCFPSIVAVDREQRVSAEELVLSGASRNTRLWALPGGRAPQPGPCPLQPEGGLLQLPQEQRSVWERERHVLCCFFFSQQEEHLWFCHCRQQCLTGLILRARTNKTRRSHRNVNNFPNCEKAHPLSCCSLFVFHWEYWFVFPPLHTPSPLFYGFHWAATTNICQHSCE